MGEEEGGEGAEFADAFEVVRGGNDDKAAADGFELAVKAHEQANTGRAEIGDSGKVKPEMMSAAADEFLQVSLEMLAPIVVEASFDFDFKGIGELLSDDFHDGTKAARFQRVRQGW